MKIDKLAAMTPFAMGAVILLSLLVIGINLYVLFHQTPEPVMQSPLPEMQHEETGDPTVAVVPAKSLQPCIFSEGIRGCVYNDRLGRKEGPDAYKWYDMDAVLWKVAR